ncbi:MAG TPA: tetratricopeptide repeat protein [Nitrospiria bacterium]|nr:tetratricopeptide repeat protein [Nitrospiria bacterium]
MVVKGQRPSGGILCVLLFGLAILQGCEDSPKRLVEQAEQKFDAGDYLGAITYYEQVSENFPKNQMADDALYWAGIIHHLFLKDDDKALQAFQKLTRDYPASPFTTDSQSYIALILERLQKTPQAIEAYEHLIEISPDIHVIQESHFKIGELYLEGGDLDQARNEWDALLKKYPSSALADKALFGIASTFYIQGRCKEALNFLDRLINDHPESELAIDAKFRAASCLEEEGHLQEALNRFREVAESYPNRLVVEKKIKALAEQLKRLEGQKG